MRYVTARVSPQETEAVRSVLPTAGWRVFEAMPVADRRHALNVANHLLHQGHDDPDLLAAALLHDAGKGHRLRLWHRVVGVLLEALMPRLLARLASPDERSRGFPWHLYLNHAALSAALAEGAGCSTRTVSLILGRGVPADDPSVLALRAADGAS